MAGKIVATFTVLSFPEGGFEIEAERDAEVPESVLVDVMRQYLDDVDGPEAPGWGKP